jgi:hypothetical protein
MTTLATITLTQSDGVGAGYSIAFDAFKTDEGALLNEFGVGIDEELTTNGVNGTRWRRRFRQFVPFTAISAGGYGSYDLAWSDAVKIRGSVGDYCSLGISIDGVNYEGRATKILGADPQVYSGKYVSNSGVLSACIVCRWRLQFIGP